MKTLIRNTAIDGLSLFFVSQILSGLVIVGGVATLLFGGFVLAIMSIVIRPVISLLTLPLNLITFGTFSFLVNALILYLLTILVPQISINPFVFEGFSFGGFIIPKISFNAFFAYVACASVLSVVASAIRWLIK